MWQTDITYVWSDGGLYYVSFMYHVYTRRILASHYSRDLSATSRMHCLPKALASRKGEDLSGLIIYADRGIQYTSKPYKDYLDDWELIQNMVHNVWQNAYCERVNLMIKNNYLACYTTDSYR